MKSWIGLGIAAAGLWLGACSSADGPGDGYTNHPEPDSGGSPDSSQKSDATTTDDGVPDIGSTGSDVVSSDITTSDVATADGDGRTVDSSDASTMDRADAVSCQTPIAADPVAGQRAACMFGTGAKVTDTLPITEPSRAALPIKHIIVLMKENRSFDHMLGGLHTAGQPDVEAIPPSFSNQDNAGATVASFHLASTCINKDPGHQWDEMHQQVNGGAMDGFVKSAAKTTSTDGHFAMGTYGPADLPFYYWLANTFAINDRHFASVRSGTFPDRNFLLLGTADGVKCTGCGFPSASTPTIFGSLDAAHVTWGVYSDGSLLSGTLDWTLSHPGAHRFADFKTVLANGTLPQVTFVDGIDNVEDEHPTGDVQHGEAWTRDIYQTAIASPLWPGLAIVWTYDEAGGFADHVPPPNKACVARPAVAKDLEYVELGARVPMAVISPYARPHYVSHVTEEHTAITRFIEAVFGLAALTARDANSTALLDMFDFGCAPSLLHPPSAPSAGKGGCFGQIVLKTDQPNYASVESMSIAITFSGVAMPHANDWIGIYKYGTVPSEVNPPPSVAWGYIGGNGWTAQGAPMSGVVTITKSSVNGGMTWPLAPGGWIAYYMPALANGGDGHTPAASVNFNVVP